MTGKLRGEVASDANASLAVYNVKSAVFRLAGAENHQVFRWLGAVF